MWSCGPFSRRYSSYCDLGRDDPGVHEVLQARQVVLGLGRRLEVHGCRLPSRTAGVVRPAECAPWHTGAVHRAARRARLGSPAVRIPSGDLAPARRRRRPVRPPAPALPLLLGLLLVAALVGRRRCCCAATTPGGAAGRGAVRLPAALRPIARAPGRPCPAPAAVRLPAAQRHRPRRPRAAPSATRWPPAASPCVATGNAPAPARRPARRCGFGPGGRARGDAAGRPRLGQRRSQPVPTAPRGARRPRARQRLRPAPHAGGGRRRCCGRHPVAAAPAPSPDGRALLTGRRPGRPRRPVPDHRAARRRRPAAAGRRAADRGAEQRRRPAAAGPRRPGRPACCSAARPACASPQPAAFADAAARLGVAPAECVHVDDLAENVRGAVAAGLVGVLHRTRAATLAELEALLGTLADRRLSRACDGRRGRPAEQPGRLLPLHGDGHHRHARRRRRDLPAAGDRASTTTASSS